MAQLVFLARLRRTGRLLQKDGDWKTVASRRRGAKDASGRGARGSQEQRAAVPRLCPAARRRVILVSLLHHGIMASLNRHLGHLVVSGGIWKHATQVDYENIVFLTKKCDIR